ncbi:hypothetical protein TNCV_4950311 [Trichonephila clavipes]|nr:hypothetical protein TNCV_4950311 [Trichonephila clavipes]
MTPRLQQPRTFIRGDQPYGPVRIKPPTSGVTENIRALLQSQVLGTKSDFTMGTYFVGSQAFGGRNRVPEAQWPNGSVSRFHTTGSRFYPGQGQFNLQWVDK